MPTMTDERCAACGTVFGGASKPKWAFTREGRPAGRVHTSCSNRQADRLIQGYGDTQEAAQIEIWLRCIRGYPERESDAWLAMFLLRELTVDLSADARERLDWWIANRSMGATSEREPAILQARSDLIAEFRAWQRSLCPVPPPLVSATCWGASDV